MIVSTSAGAALDRLLDLPDTRRLAGLSVAFEEFAQACAAAVPEPETIIEDLRAFVREHYAALLKDPTFAHLIEGPRRRTNMMAWLLRENVGNLERAKADLSLRGAEIERLREEVARIESERLTLEADLHRSRTLADRGLAAAGLVHDFNNLLQSISGHASIALGDLPAEHPDHEPLAQVMEAARRAAELSQGLARWDHDELPTARPVDVNRAVEGVLKLVMNAWQAIGTRQGTVRVTTGVTESREEELVYVEVADDGPGLADEARDRVFEPFYTTRKDGGGIGLPNVRLLVERWGGRIEVWSSRGAGARFRASLPVVPEEGEEGEA